MPPKRSTTPPLPNQPYVFQKGDDLVPLDETQRPYLEELVLVHPVIASPLLALLGPTPLTSAASALTGHGAVVPPLASVAPALTGYGNVAFPSASAAPALADGDASVPVFASAAPILASNNEDAEPPQPLVLAVSARGLRVTTLVSDCAAVGGFVASAINPLTSPTRESAAASEAVARAVVTLGERGPNTDEVFLVDDDDDAAGFTRNDKSEAAQASWKSNPEPAQVQAPRNRNTMSSLQPQASNRALTRAQLLLAESSEEEDLQKRSTNTSAPLFGEPARKPTSLPSLPAGSVALPPMRFSQAPPLLQTDSPWRPDSPPYPETEQEPEGPDDDDPFGADGRAPHYDGVLHPEAERLVRLQVLAGTCLPPHFRTLTQEQKATVLVSFRGELVRFSPHLTCGDCEAIKILEASRYLNTSRNAVSPYSAARLAVTKEAAEMPDIDAYLGWSVLQVVSGADVRMRFVKNQHYRGRLKANEAHVKEREDDNAKLETASAISTTVGSLGLAAMTAENAVLRARLAALGAPLQTTEQQVAPPPALWDPERLSDREKEIRAKHLKTKHHTSASKGESGWSEAKFAVLELGGPFPEDTSVGGQKDSLIEKVLADCGTCKRMRADKKAQQEQEARTRAETDQAAATRDRRFAERYEHVLEGNDEYDAPEEDSGHDATCTHCKRDPDSRKQRQGMDCLYNCDGCSAAFHPACRDLGGMLQATAAECAKRNIIAVTWARKHLPWLCGKCWSISRVREAEAEASRLREEVARLRRIRARHEVGGAARGTASAKAPIPHATAVNSSLCPSSAAHVRLLTEIEERDRLFAAIYETSLRHKGAAQKELTVGFDLTNTEETQHEDVRVGSHYRKSVVEAGGGLSYQAQRARLLLPRPTAQNAMPPPGTVCHVATGRRVPMHEARPSNPSAATMHPHASMTDTEVQLVAEVAEQMEAEEVVEAAENASIPEARETFSRITSSGRSQTETTPCRGPSAPPHQDARSRLTLAHEHATITTRTVPYEKGIPPLLGDRDSRHRLTHPWEPCETPQPQTASWENPETGTSYIDNDHVSQICSEPDVAQQTLHQLGNITAGPDQPTRKEMDTIARETALVVSANIRTANRTRPDLSDPANPNEDWIRSQTPDDVYEGAVHESGPLARTQQLYGSMRQQLIDLAYATADTAVAHPNLIKRTLNRHLERTGNFHKAVLLTSDWYAAGPTDVTRIMIRLSASTTAKELDLAWRECQDGFTRCRTIARSIAMETISRDVGCPLATTNHPLSQNFLNTGNMGDAVQITIAHLKAAKERGQNILRPQIHGLRPSDDNQTREQAWQNQERMLNRQQGLTELTRTPGPGWGEQLDLLAHLTDQTQTRALTDDTDISQWLLSPMARTEATTFNQLREKHPSATHPNTGAPSTGLKKVPATLRECYDQTLMEQSMQGGDTGMRYSVQLDKPLIWVDMSPDPKYPCAGWDVTAYTAWKDHAEKRKAQGAPQRFVTYISINMVDVICAMLRVQPIEVMGLSDEELVLKLDTKFNIAQETNLLLMKFSMPSRPHALPIWELHLPSTEWSKYVTRWLKELRSQQEGGKDLEKYDLSDVFTQSLQEFKMMYDHARVLTKLPVRDLMASCSDFLQEQVINEQKTANARKQQGLLLDPSATTRVPANVTSSVSARATDPRPADFSQRRRSSLQDEGRILRSRMPARAFLTEAARPMPAFSSRIPAPPPPATVPADGPRGSVPCRRMPDQDVDCNGCGKFYKNYPDRKFPHPCYEKCQYSGHPLCTNKTKRWPYPGFSCSWRGFEDRDIPAEALARLQKYKAQKRERGL